LFFFRPRRGVCHRQKEGRNNEKEGNKLPFGDEKNSPSGTFSSLEEGRRETKSRGTKKKGNKTLKKTKGKAIL
jgi:hypothetical protein